MSAAVFVPAPAGINSFLAPPFQNPAPPRESSHGNATHMPRDSPGSNSTRPPLSPLNRYLRILYVDQLGAPRDIARLSLRRLGHTIECVTDGLAALVTVADEPPFDLVLVEHELPDMSGPEFVARLRERSYAGKIVVICSDLSGSAETEYYRLDVALILFKPVVPAALRKCLADLFPGSGRVG